MLVAPGFIDWTPYRETFAAQLSRTTGRPVTIGGEVSFAILPRPALSASAVHVGGAAGPDMLDIGRLSARLAFAPLLRGALQFRDVRLEDTTGAITLSDSWSPFASQPASPSAPSGGSAPEPFQVHVQSVEIVNGAVTVRAANGAPLVDLANMDLRGRVESRDSYTVTGALRAAGVAMAVDVRLGSGGAEGIRASSATVRLVDANAAVTASGRLALAKRTFEGDLSVSGPQGAALLATLGLPAPPRPALTKPFSLSAKVAVDGTGVAFNGLALDIGGTAATGAADWRTARTPQLTTTLDFGVFSIEDWLASPAAPAAPEGTSPPPAVSPPSAVPSPPLLSAEVALRFPALSLRGQGLRDGRVTASIANNELKISEVAVTLPGATRLSGFGLVNLAGDAAAVDGVVSLQTFDARGLFGWLGVDTAGIPPGRLSSASLQAALQGTVNFLELNDIEAAVDTARIGGRLSFAPRARPFVGIDLRVENVNFDSYRGAPPSAPPESPSAPAATARPEVYGVTPSATAFSGLGGFDAEVHVEVDGLTAGGLPGGRVGLDLGLKNGTLEIRTASFEKVAGATAWFSGAVAGFGTALQFNDLQFDLAGEDIERLAALAGVDLSPALQALGTASLTGTLNGTALQSDVTATLKAGGLTARVGGQLMELDKRPRFSGQVDAAHPKFSEIMRAASAWPANARDPGAFALQARIVQDPDKTTISDARLTIGRDRIAGSAEILRADGRTQVTASLTDILFDLDRVMPPMPPAPARPATTGAAPAADAAPAEQETWTFLQGWSGDISVAGPGFTARGVQLQDFSARIVVADDAAELADWQGKIFGAPGQLALRLTATPPAVQGQLTVNKADFRALVAAVNGGRTNLKSSGTANVVASFSAKGPSAADLAASLSGNGTLTVSGTETGGGLSAGLFGPLSAAAQLDVGTPGKPAPVTLSTRLSAANGVITLETAEVSSRSHTGAFTGTLSLPRRQVDLSGTLVPRKAGEDKLPIAIKGPVDRPNIRLLPPPR